ncbi:YihY/virulence factor BrkB family protein [Micrococcus terreus]|uniref:YihY/virulence factor BrkB family protein n=1 Tax=Micrococcus terreus TaxID=574650 RepID=UPI0033F64F52
MSTQNHIDETLDAADAPTADSKKKPQTPVKLKGTSWKYAFKRAVKEFTADGGTDLAAMLTYYTVLSLAPALLAIFSIVSLVLANNADTVTGLVDDVVTQYVPADYQGLVTNLVETMTSSATGGVIALIIGIATALWSSSAYVKAFSRCMNTIYGRTEGRTLIKQTGTMLLTTLAMLLGIVLILVSIALNETVVTAVLGPIAEPLGLGGMLTFLTQSFLPIWAWAKWPFILALVIGMIALLYYTTPNVKQPKFTWISMGAVVAIIGIAIAAVALSIYFAQFAGYSSYGAIGSVMALLFALWVFNIVLLLGAEVDAEVERARELQAGIPAEESIQLPPRDTAKVEKMKDTRDQLEQEGRILRMTHGEQSSADGSAGQGTGADRPGAVGPDLGSTGRGSSAADS